MKDTSFKPLLVFLDKTSLTIKPHTAVVYGLKEEFHTDVIAYVLMPNHLHAIFYFENETFNLNTLLVMEKDSWLMKLLTG